MTRKPNQLTGAVEQVAIMALAGGREATYALEHGECMRPSRKTVELGELGECFANAGRMADVDPTLTYVEGYAIPRSLVEAGIPMVMEHAWLTDQQGRVIEPTWPDGGWSYLGVAIDTDCMLGLVAERSHWGVLPRLARDWLTRADGR